MDRVTEPLGTSLDIRIKKRYKRSYRSLPLRKEDVEDHPILMRRLDLNDMNMTRAGIDTLAK
jgi:hypothetical protein